jgi:SAM-dependent methyltransferase
MNYEADDRIRRKVAEGRHRQVIGGMWEQMGRLQLDFLVAEGLQPDHRLIDIGCGSLRAGVPLTGYLQPGRYFGVDSHQSLLDAGWTREIKGAGLADKLPRANLAATAEFDLSGFGVQFDYGIAQSVFTHLPAGRLTDCLSACAPWFRPGGRLYVTYFERPATAAPNDPLPHQPGGVVTHPDRDPFDVTQAALLAKIPEGWRLEIVGPWDHPRDQRMARLVRL